MKVIRAGLPEGERDPFGTVRGVEYDPTLYWEDAVRLDLYYVENWSVLLDHTILLLAVVVAVVARGSDAY